MRKFAALLLWFLLICQEVKGDGYPYPGMFAHFDRNAYETFSPALKEVACYERFIMQAENGDFTIYVLDRTAWLQEQRIAYLILSTGHCDYFSHARIEQCLSEDAADNSTSLSFRKIVSGDPLQANERIYPSEQALLGDRGGDAVRVKCGTVDSIKPYLTTTKLKWGSCHARGHETDGCYYEPSVTPTYNDAVGTELEQIRAVIQNGAH
jgi:hypothetical protein